MSQIIFGNTENMLILATPSSGYIVAYDTDGIIKQKDTLGNIVPIGKVATFSFYQVLSAGNNSQTYSIIMGTSTGIKSVNGGGYLSLDSVGASAVSLSTDSGALNETYFTLTPDSIKLNYNYLTSKTILQAGTAGDLNISAPQQLLLDLDGKELILSGVSTFSTTNFSDKYSSIISSRNSTVNNNVVNSVILGGQGLTASASNTVYVSGINVNNAYTLPTSDGTNGYVLKTNGSGVVTWAVDSSNSTLAQVLSIGNTTSGNSIYLSDGDKILSVGSTVSLDFQNGAKFLGKYEGSGYIGFVDVNKTQSKLDFRNTSSGNGGYIDIEESEMIMSHTGSISVISGNFILGDSNTKDTPLRFENSSNSFALTIQSGVLTGNYTLTLPTSQGGSNTFLRNDGTGVLTWGTASPYSLYDTLNIGNTTSTDIILSNGHYIRSTGTASSRSEISLIGGTSGVFPLFLIDNDPTLNKSWIFGDRDSLDLGFNDNGLFANDLKVELNSTTGSISAKIIADSINQKITLGVKDTNTNISFVTEHDSIQVLSNWSGQITNNGNQKFPSSISSKNGTFSQYVFNSVIVGGTGLVATQSETVYLGNNVNINNKYTLPNTDGQNGYVLKTDGQGIASWQPDDLGPTHSLADTLLAGNTTGTSSINFENFASFVGQGVTSSITNWVVGMPLSGFQYYLTGDYSTAIYTGAKVRVTNTPGGTNDGTFVVTNATYSGGNTYFQWSSIQSNFGGPSYGDVTYGIQTGYLKQDFGSYSNYWTLPNKSGIIALTSDLSAGLTSLTSSSNSGINLINGVSTTIDTIYNTGLDPTLAMPTAVGGLPVGTTAGYLSGMNMVQLFNDILFPTVNPTYTIPTISVSSNVTGVREIGLTVSPTVTITGTENDANYFSQLVINRNINSLGSLSIATVSASASMTIVSASSIAAQFGYADPNNPNYSYSISTSENIQVPAPVSGGSSTIVYSGVGDYTAGVAKKNNKGITHGASPAIRSTSSPQAGDVNFAANTQTITGYYPYFYGKTSTSKTASDIKSIIESGTGFTKVVNSGSGSLSMSFNATGEWPWFAVYSVYPTKTAWYENALNNGSIGAPTDLFASPTTLSVVSSDGYWTVTFKIYPANKVTTIGTATIS